MATQVTAKTVLNNKVSFEAVDMSFSGVTVYLDYPASFYWSCLPGGLEHFLESGAVIVRLLSGNFLYPQTEKAVVFCYSNDFNLKQLHSNVVVYSDLGLAPMLPKFYVLPPTARLDPLFFKDLAPDAAVFSVGTAAREFANQFKSSDGNSCVIFIDRALDYLKLVTPSKCILDQIYVDGTCAPLSSYKGIQVPFFHNGNVVVQQWMELLLDYPVDGLNLLRKKILDLGIKMRILGKPSKSQFEQMIALLMEKETKSEILLFIQLIADSIDHKSWIDSTITDAVDLDSVISLIHEAPTESLKRNFAQWALLYSMSRGNLDPKLKKVLDSMFTAEKVDKFCVSVPEQIPDLISYCLLALEHEPSFFQSHQNKLYNFMMGQKTPLQYEKIIFCVTGPVSWEEVKLVRDYKQKDIILVSCGISGNCL